MAIYSCHNSILLTVSDVSEGRVSTFHIPKFEDPYYLDKKERGFNRWLQQLDYNFTVIPYCGGLSSRQEPDNILIGLLQFSSRYNLLQKSKPIAIGPLLSGRITAMFNFGIATQAGLFFQYYDSKKFPLGIRTTFGLDAQYSHTYQSNRNAIGGFFSGELLLKIKNINLTLGAGIILFKNSPLPDSNMFMFGIDNPHKSAKI